MECQCVCPFKKKIKVATPFQLVSSFLRIPPGGDCSGTGTACSSGCSSSGPGAPGTSLPSPERARPPARRVPPRGSPPARGGASLPPPRVGAARAAARGHVSAAPRDARARLASRGAPALLHPGPAELRLRCPESVWTGGWLRTEGSRGPWGRPAGESCS